MTTLSLLSMINTKKENPLIRLVLTDRHMSGSQGKNLPTLGKITKKIQIAFCIRPRTSTIFGNLTCRKDIYYEKYSYKKEDCNYVVCKNGEILYDNDKHFLFSSSEELINAIVEELNEDDSSIWDFEPSLILFHYAYCKLKLDESRPQYEKALKERYCEHALFNDPYLMLFQDSPVKSAIAVYYRDAIPEEVREYSDELFAILLGLSKVSGSFVFGYNMIDEMLTSEPESKPEDAVEEMIEVLVDFWDEENRDDVDEEDEEDVRDYEEWLENLKDLYSKTLLYMYRYQELIEKTK